MKTLGSDFNRKKSGFNRLLVSLIGATLCLYFLGFYQFPRILSGLQLREWVGSEEVGLAVIIDKQIRKKLSGETRLVEYHLIYFNPENLNEPATLSLESEAQWKAYSTGDSLPLLRTPLGDFPKIISDNSLGSLSQLALDSFGFLVELAGLIFSLYTSFEILKLLQKAK